MAVKLKKIADQVIVVTGASSGIGLTIAELAARKGAKLVLISRNERDMKESVERIRQEGGEAIYAVADVTRPDELRRASDEALKRFGRIDTWINNAGVTIFGRLDETPLEEKRRLFDVNFWGVVHGSELAASHLKKQGGALINIGSVVSERAIPLQGIYSASKHAVKAYTDSFRMELEHEGAPISVTLIKPAAINTPYTEHARNHLERHPSLPPPVYSPDVVANAVLYCAEHPRRDIIVGGGGKIFSLAEKFIPRIADRIMERTLFETQGREQPGRRNDALFRHSGDEGRAHGDHRGHVARSSLYTSMALRPAVTLLFVVGAGFLTLAGWKLYRERAVMPRPNLGKLKERATGFFKRSTSAA